MKFDIRVLDEQDWQAYRSIRLASLQDSPDSFGSTYELERALSDQKWKSRLSKSSDSSNGAMWAAVFDDKFIGLVSAVVSSVDVDHASIYQMWVSPEYRGEGIGSALIRSVVVWAVQLRVKRLELSVTTVNTAAVSLYKKMGFVSTGNTEWLRPGSDLSAQPMSLSLDFYLLYVG